MDIKNKNIIQALAVALLLSLILGMALGSNTKAVQVTKKDNYEPTAAISENNIENEVESGIESENQTQQNKSDTPMLARAYTVNGSDIGVESSEKVSNNVEGNSDNISTVSENSIDESEHAKVEVTDNYVVYVLARVLNTNDKPEEQRFRCVINKNEAGAKTGLVDIILNSDTKPLIDDNTDMDVEEYKADVKVNHAGEWLHTGNYYEIEFNEGSDNELIVTTIGNTDETEVDNWKQGRALNSTFVSDMQIIKESEPSEIYSKICNEYQYTWTFEQIETFKAYVESLSGEEKEKWLQAVTETGLTVGY